METVQPTLIPLIDRFIREMQVRKVYSSPATVKCVRYSLYSLARSFGARPVNRFTKEAVDRWFKSTPNIAKSTQRVRVNYAKALSRWLYDTKRIKADAIRDYPTPRLKRRTPVTLSPEEVAALLAYVGQDRRDRLIVLLMVQLGCRCVEVARLEVDSYNARTRIINVTGKFEDERLLPVDDQVAEALDAYLDEVGRIRGPLIRSKRLDYNPGPLTTGTLSDYMTKWMRAAGVKRASYDGRSAHGLRRTAATDVMNKERDITVVQRMLGHKRAETTALYVQPPGFDRLASAMAGRTYGTT
jgi:integrase